MSVDASPGRSEPARLFKEAMASFPSGVTIVTTADDEGRWWGFTATSFCSVSMDPPLVLVCLSRSARCHPAFQRASHWLVHVIDPADAALALRFASKGADKFADAGFTVDERGLPALDRACVRLDCATHARHPGGDHTILVGEVERAHLRPATPAVYYRRDFRSLA
ncbi:flavin reductase [Prauserella sp. PE36]|uniref:flavin reductase family protein n=1 Tax=Prauserella sp. PE36 TaxID=1504709 RepID=UPI000D9F1DD3|nr:flavin reductase family protein [Prauserella sp. PE36]PXY33257.1 flavin reductase [Prauserella coralliicola]RBM16191.1 flavin reductase [Prauserella sp. PE36]